MTIVKNKETRESKGVAFVLFIDKASALRAVHSLNRKELFGRTIKCSIAADNGRTTEFIKRRTYKDKSKCYECGEEGHLSYRCPKNALGDRQQPEKKPKKKPAAKQSREASARESEEEDQQIDDDLSLGDAIRWASSI